VEETVELRTAIENLYATFASYPLRNDTNACTCCHSPEDEKGLHKTSLRELKANDLELYATDALFVWGNVDDFRHFLPRIFELAVKYGQEFVDQSIVFNKLYHGEWRCWPEAEQSGVEHFFRALWACFLNQEPHDYLGDEIEDWLCGIAQAVSDLSPYLVAWLALETENARLNLARFIAETDFLNPSYHATAFWGERAELFGEVTAWVRGDAVRARMSAIASEYSQYDFVERAFTSLP
jgi:hypothetical protein